MSKKKDFKIKTNTIKNALISSEVDSPGEVVPPIKKSVTFPASTSNQKTFDFAPFYSKGYDDIVYRCQSTIERFLSNAISSNQLTMTVGTIIGYCNGGLVKLFAFCESLISVVGSDLELSDIDKGFIAKFKKYLEVGFSYGAQRTVYFRVKSVLLGINGQDFKSILPKNPYPSIKRLTKSEKAYSKFERKGIVQALSTEIHRIKGETTPLSASDLSYCVLWLSSCTGINTQPLIELRTDALQPHLFHPHKRVLVTFKRRGKNTHITTLRRSDEIETIQEIAPRVDTVFQMVEIRNGSLRLNSEYKDSLFVFLQSTNREVTPTRLTSSPLTYAAKLLSKKYELKCDDGTPLQVNITRLRKTFANRVFELSGYDPVIAAALAGHTLKVSDDHYLAPPPEAEKNHAFMGEIRNQELLSFNADSTPVASCADNKNGHKAPKNGSVCLEVFGCFKCPSFVVTGDDLYKLFSFYMYVVSLRKDMGAKQWKQTHGYIIRVIERDIAPKFSDDVVFNAKQRAKISPHPLWKTNHIDSPLIAVEEF